MCVQMSSGSTRLLPANHRLECLTQPLVLVATAQPPPSWKALFTVRVACISRNKTGLSQANTFWSRIATGDHYSGQRRPRIIIPPRRVIVLLCIVMDLGSSLCFYQSFRVLVFMQFPVPYMGNAQGRGPRHNSPSSSWHWRNKRCYCHRHRLWKPQITLQNVIRRNCLRSIIRSLRQTGQITLSFIPSVKIQTLRNLNTNRVFKHTSIAVSVTQRVILRNVSFLAFSLYTLPQV